MNTPSYGLHQYNKGAKMIGWKLSLMQVLGSGWEKRVSPHSTVLHFCLIVRFTVRITKKSPQEIPSTEHRSNHLQAPDGARYKFQLDPCLKMNGFLILMFKMPACQIQNISFVPDGQVHTKKRGWQQCANLGIPGSSTKQLTIFTEIG